MFTEFERSYRGCKPSKPLRMTEEVTCDMCGETYEVAGYEDGDGWPEPYHFVPFDEDETCPVCEGKGVPDND